MNTRLLALYVALTLFSGCAGGDSTVLSTVAEDKTVIAPAPPELPDFGGSCPAGWSGVLTPDGVVTVCSPWPEQGMDSCLPGQVHLPGESSCTPVGSECPTDDWSEELHGSRQYLYVHALGAVSGDGSMERPFGTLDAATKYATPGTTIMVSKGVFNESVTIPAGVTMVGACADETIVTPPSTTSKTAAVEAKGHGTGVRDLTIRGGWPGILVSGADTSMRVHDVVIEQARGYGIHAAAGADVTLESVLVVSTEAVSEGTGDGQGLHVETGAQVSLIRSVLRANHTAGIQAQGDGTNVHLDGVVVADTRLGSDERGGDGLLARDGAVVIVDDSIMTRNFRSGAHATTGGRLKLAMVVIEQTVGVPHDGYGILVADSGHLEARALLLDGNRYIGIAGRSPGSHIEVADLVIQNTIRRQVGSDFAAGLMLSLGITDTTVTRGYLVNNSYAGVLVLGCDSELHLTDVVVKDTQPVEGEAGYGLVAFEQTSICGERLLFIGNSDSGITATGNEARIVLNDLEVRDSIARACPQGPCYGNGLGAYKRGFIETRRFLIAQNDMCGVQTADEGALYLQDGRIQDNLYGACLFEFVPDIPSVTNNVAYVGNLKPMNISGYRPIPEGDLAHLGDVQSPRMLPCHPGWRTTPLIGVPDVVVCAAWPETGRQTCPTGMAHYPGEPECVRVGSTCPVDHWATSLPAADEILFVRPFATPGGLGTQDQPFASINEAVAHASPGTLIALSKGTYHEDVILPQGTTLWGACPEQTIVASARTTTNAGTITISSSDITVGNLSVEGERPGVWVSGPAATARLEALIIARNQHHGLHVADGASAVASRILVTDTHPGLDLVGGHGLFVETGGRLTVRHAVLDSNSRGGVFARNSGTYIQLRDVAVMDTTLAADEGGGHGIYADESASVEVHGCVISGNHGGGVHATDQALVSLSDAFIENNGQYKGHGIRVERRARVQGTRLYLNQNRVAGVSASHDGSILDMMDMVVTGTRSRLPADRNGFGIFTFFGIRDAYVTRALFHDNVHSGILTMGSDSKLELFDVAVRNTKQSNGEYGHGITALPGTQVVGTRVLIESNYALGLAAVGPETDVNIADIVIRNTKRAAGDRDLFPIQHELGYGVFVKNSRLNLKRFLITENHLLGLQLAEGTSVNLQDGEVSYHPIGVSVAMPAGPELDSLLSGLSNGVRYVGNDITLHNVSSSLPVPTAVPPPPIETQPIDVEDDGGDRDCTQ